MTKETIGKALQSVQKHVDQLINTYATVGPGFAPGEKHHDYEPFIEAIKARDRLQREFSQAGP
jgi:hypothetical protein